MTDPFILIAAVVIAVLSTGRLTRLLVQDHFPPSVWIRTKWDDITDGGSWNLLLHCHWCLAPWLAIPVILWGWLSELHTSWWLLNGWLAIAYLASMVVERDEVE